MLLAERGLEGTDSAVLDIEDRHSLAIPEVRNAVHLLVEEIKSLYGGCGGT